ncbi:MAG: monovalent cation/H(+) antiporter subunit G [Bdellovibrionaceae bacterium]|nr:monovalent cation/H(+) antiporter subunit G [Pseudobdellovibrionaceae bacterium]
MSEWLDLIGWSFVLLGTFFVFLAAVGIFKLPDTLTRMAAGAKAPTLALMLAVAGAMLHSASAGVRLPLFLGFVMVLVTSPVAAHLLGRATIRAGLRVIPTTQNTELLQTLRDQPHPEDEPPEKRI